ncbi:unnamed protein product [Vitrella brassicaformis CCMP3155]|uniref:ubiquitinyl hydrolase 1 n=5 Tax=Vitrella brassicaformis TaxID=1169539 RepID=A0A0G4GWR8_VITBC|nr:unnamed protein product [Vitrella brassicaformis CCMP3155]|eukprot:CEM35289.1 unnamed protein product [Vitrella brassicaformis CCMP3155]
MRSEGGDKNFKEGEVLDFQDEQSDWRVGHVVEVSEDNTAVKLAYVAGSGGANRRHDRDKLPIQNEIWIPVNSDRLLKPWAPGMRARVGHRVDYRDVHHGQWVEARIVEVGRDGRDEESYKVKYKSVGGSKVSDWVATNSDRLTAVGTHTGVSQPSRPPYQCHGQNPGQPPWLQAKRPASRRSAAANCKEGTTDEGAAGGQGGGGGGGSPSGTPSPALSSPGHSVTATPRNAQQAMQAAAGGDVAPPVVGPSAAPMVPVRPVPPASGSRSPTQGPGAPGHAIAFARSSQLNPSQSQPSSPPPTTTTADGAAAATAAAAAGLQAGPSGDAMAADVSVPAVGGGTEGSLSLFSGDLSRPISPPDANPGPSTTHTHEDQRASDDMPPPVNQPPVSTSSLAAAAAAASAANPSTNPTARRGGSTAGPRTVLRGVGAGGRGVSSRTNSTASNQNAAVPSPSSCALRQGGGGGGGGGAGRGNSAGAGGGGGSRQQSLGDDRDSGASGVGGVGAGRGQGSSANASGASQQQLQQQWDGQPRIDERFAIRVMASDGNCLFRSVADQMYGNPDLHRLVRTKCMEYMEAEREYFQQFVTDRFEEHVHRMKQDGEWGDDVEIEAMSEMYDCRIEIYGYSNEALRTFHETCNACNPHPMRLSYRGGSHYNSIVLRHGQRPLTTAAPGCLENRAISRSRNRRRQRDLHAPVQGDDTQLDEVIQRSRREFEHRSEAEMERALRASREEYHRKEGNEIQQMDNEIFETVLNQSSLEEDERALLEAALRESLGQPAVASSSSSAAAMQPQPQPQPPPPVPAPAPVPAAAAAAAAASSAGPSHMDVDTRPPPPPTQQPQSTSNVFVFPSNLGGGPAPFDVEGEAAAIATALATAVAATTPNLGGQGDAVMQPSGQGAGAGGGGEGGEYADSVLAVMSLGFPLEHCMQAYRLFGDNEEDILAYCCQKLQQN